MNSRLNRRETTPSALPCDTRRVLQEARALIAQGWTQGEFARKAGVPTGTSALGSDCWCASGALSHVALRHGDYDMPAKDKARRVLGDVLGPDFAAYGFSLPRWNDDPARTQEEVLALFDKAIALAEADDEASRPEA